MMTITRTNGSINEQPKPRKCQQGGIAMAVMSKTFLFLFFLTIEVE
jgi:hypothetical protein